MVFSTLFLSAQYDNDWIDFNKTYYKYYVEETGIHRISYTLLSLTDLPLHSDSLRLFNKGEQVPIYVSSQGALQAGDYIEFYGEQNDGEFDTKLFDTPDDQLQDKTSLFIDKAAYFLVNDTTIPPLRFEDIPNDISTVPAAEEYFTYTSTNVIDQSFHFGRPFFTSGTFSYYSTFDTGEGFCSSLIKEIINPVTGNNVGTPFKVATDHLYESAPQDAILKTTLVGRNKSTGVIQDKFIQVVIEEDTLISDSNSMINFEKVEFEVPFSTDLIETVPDFTGTAFTRVKHFAWDGIGPGGFAFDTRYSAAEVSITYPREFNFANKTQFNFEILLDSPKYIEVENFNGGLNPILYDLTTNQRISPLLDNGIYKFYLENSDGQSHEYFISNTSNTNNIVSGFTRNFTNYASANNQGDYLILTHKDLRIGTVDHVQAYADYRASAEGGNYQVVVADIEELYDQFGWGIEKHPLAIRNWIQYCYNEWSITPEHLFIIGKGVRYDKTRSNTTNFDDCLVPSFGFVSSDLMFVSNDVQDYLPLMAVGRIPVLAPFEVENYLNKVVEYEQWQTLTECENVSDRAWMKRKVGLAKGWGIQETQVFENSLAVQNTLLNESDCNAFDVLDTFQDFLGPIPSGQSNAYSTQDSLSNYIDNGLGLISFIGHSSVIESYWQFDFQHPTEYQNFGKYPFITSQSSFSGKIHEAQNQNIDYLTEKNVLTSDWVLAPERGAIAALGFTALSSPAFLNVYMNKIYELLGGDACGQTIGKVIQQAVTDLYHPNDNGIQIVSSESAFCGDPAIVLPHWENPELAIQVEDVPFWDMGSSSNNELEIDFLLQNYGAVLDNAGEVNFALVDENGVVVWDETSSFAIPILEEAHTFTIAPDPTLPSANYSIMVTVDDNAVYTEDCEVNNEVANEIGIQNGPPIPLEGIELSVKVFLEGPYADDETMDTGLTAVIPLIQAYATGPWFYGGGETLTTIPSAMVDWVLVEARTGVPNISGSAGTTVVETIAGILLDNGEIIGVDGAPIRFNNLMVGDEYYFAIRHRNHLSVLTATAVTASTQMSYDFTTAVGQAFGTEQQSLSADGKAMMISGDANIDNIIQITDYDAWVAEPAAIGVYKATDFNLDGIIQVTDYDQWFVNKAKLGIVEF